MQKGNTEVWLKIQFFVNKRYPDFKYEFSSWIDLYILDTIARDTLKKFKSKIKLWRFHRRFDNDKTGHAPSLLIYTRQKYIKIIERYIGKHRELEYMLDQKYIRKHRVYLFEGIKGQSDPRWWEQIAATWPYFAQGFSEMLLQIINRYFQDYKDREYKLRMYKQIDREISDLWAKHARHAFFHHLFAAFGYKPFIMDII